MDNALQKPEEWLKFIAKERKSYDGPDKYRFTTRLYRRAVASIPVNEYGHNNTAYAKILVDFAKLKAFTSEDDARNIFRSAKNCVKHCSLVYVAWAQFELLHNNPAKCQKLLNKGKLLRAEPKYLLDIALENLSFGNTQLIDEETEEHTFTELINRSTLSGRADDSGCFVTHELKESDSSSDSCSPTELPSPGNFHLSSVSLQQKYHGRKATGNGVPSEVNLVTGTANTDLASRINHGLKITSVVSNSRQNFSSNESNTCQSNLPENSLLSTRPKYQSSGSSSGSGDDMDSCPLLLKNRTSVAHGSIATPQNIKETPQASSVSTSIKNNQRRVFERLPFVGLPRRAFDFQKKTQVSFKEENKYPKLEERQVTGNREGQIPGNPKEKDDIDDNVFPISEKEQIPVLITENQVPNSTHETKPQNRTKRSQEILSTIQENPSNDEKQQRDQVDRVDGKRRVDVESNTSEAHQHYIPPKNCVSEQYCPASEGNLYVKQVKTSMQPSTTAYNNSQQGYKTASDSNPVNATHAITPGIQHYGRSQFQPRVPHGAPVGQSISRPSHSASNAILVVNGKVYNKLNLIGKGGSSKVYTVFDGKQTCAIKYVNVDEADPQVIQSYINEITLLKRLQGHEGIIKLYDWEMNEEEKVIKLVMEIGCLDLAGYLKENREKITMDFIKYHWKQILDAVQVVHDEGIVHSDLKPANFLLVRGNLKLIDFGIANAIQGDATSFFRDTQIGTLNYMSPEQLRDISQSGGPAEHHRPIMKIGRASDVWSLGCILYLMVYGKTPFQHIPNHIRKWQCIMDPNYEIKFPDIDNQDLIDTMKGCLRRNPQERYTIPQLKSHSFLTAKTTGKMKISGKNVDDVVNCIMQMKEVNSPRTFLTLTQNMLQQLSSGGSLDMAPIQGLHTSQNVDSDLPSRPPLQLAQPPRRSQPQEQRTVQPSRLPLHETVPSGTSHGRKKNMYFAGGPESDKENAMPGTLR